MSLSINTKRTYFGNDDDSSIDDEDRLIDDDTNTDNPMYEPSVFYRTGDIRDRYKFGYITFCLLGILTLLPWNFFATATNYWMYKFRDVESNVTSTNKTDLQAEFTSYLAISSTGPSLFFLIINIIFAHRISFQIRIIGSMVVILFLFIITAALVSVNTDEWQNIFFAITILTSIVMNIFSGFLQASVWGLASKFSAKYISAATKGQALGGIFAALIYIVSLALATSVTTSAMLYFSIATALVIAGLIFYKFLSTTDFFKYHLLQKTPARALNYDPAEKNDSTSAFEPPNVSITGVLAKVWSYGFSVAMCYTVTLSVYPAVTVLVSSTDPKNEWAVKYFVPTVAFLMFSVYDLAGRVFTCGWIIRTERLIIGFSFLRVIFVPLILLCNAHPRHFLPVLIDNDTSYIALNCLFAYTNGCLTSITMVRYRSAVEDVEKDMASSLMAVFIGIGCAVGSGLSFIMLKIL